MPALHRMPGKDRKKIVKRESLFWGILILALFIDIGTKNLASNHYLDNFPLVSQEVIHNKGVSFGLFHNIPYMLFVIIGIVLIAVLVFFRYKSITLKTDIVIALLIGGALGNIYDRARFGAVRDFIQWPTFNMADVFICTGIAFYLVDSLYHKQEKEKHE